MNASDPNGPEVFAEHMAKVDPEMGEELALEIEGATQVRPGLYVANESKSVFMKSEARPLPDAALQCWICGQWIERRDRSTAAMGAMMDHLLRSHPEFVGAPESHSVFMKSAGTWREGIEGAIREADFISERFTERIAKDWKTMPQEEFIAVRAKVWAYDELVSVLKMRLKEHGE